MILKHFPGHGNTSHRAADFSFFHRQNVIVYAKSSDVSFAEHTAPLSIKSCLKGREIYELNRVPLAVEENKYLVVNNGQLYSSYILANEEVESFCVFFQDGLELEALTVFENSPENLLDNPDGKGNRMRPFFQNLRQKNSLVAPLLSKIHREISEGESSRFWLDEQCRFLIEALLWEQKKIIKEIERLPMIRQTTRIEIFRRLCLAKDYIESCFDEPVGLKRLAEISCLSPHHFLRLFKAAFHQTPHQYLTGVRLQRALKLIENRNYSITDICFSVGFENPSSFTRLFKSRFHLSPQQMRRAK